jgi:hypothetical protein
LRPVSSSSSSSKWISRFSLGLICLVLAAGCDSQVGSIDVKNSPPVGIEEETRPLKAPAAPKAR